MTRRNPALVTLAVAALAAVLVACSGGGGSAPPSTAARSASHSSHTAEVPLRSEPLLISVEKPSLTGSGSFTGSLDEVKTLIGYYHSIRLTPEQERLKVEALSAMSAPCCKQYSLATCCCPCNMAKAAWGLAAQLITEKGMNAEQIRAAEASWLKRVNPNGFTGDSCFTGGCTRPMRANGCGGMKEENIVF